MKDVRCLFGRHGEWDIKTVEGRWVLDIWNRGVTFIRCGRCWRLETWWSEGPDAGEARLRRIEQQLGIVPTPPQTIPSLSRDSEGKGEA